MSTEPMIDPHDLEIIEIETDSGLYVLAKEVRFQALYAEMGLPRTLVEDADVKAYRHLIAIADAEVVGYGRIRMIENPPKIFQVCIAEAHRNRGIGAALVRMLEEIARSDGCTDVVLDARSHVIGFYELLGYAVFGSEFLSERTHTPHRKMWRSLC